MKFIWVKKKSLILHSKFNSCTNVDAIYSRFSAANLDFFFLSCVNQTKVSFIEQNMVTNAGRTIYGARHSEMVYFWIVSYLLNLLRSNRVGLQLPLNENDVDLFAISIGCCASYNNTFVIRQFTATRTLLLNELFSILCHIIADELVANDLGLLMK